MVKLNLSYNLIASCVENEGFERLSHLNNFMDLDLSYNMFNDNRILLGLSEHSSVKHLSLAYNQIGLFEQPRGVVPGGNEIKKIVISQGTY
ncbi:hypothetical protein Patl1_19588 [Pistacia atlantica]|uniref:Uncharacterized protein n=1 Tax=Pistacia atlantica TaxID=434234 RepID=A0ACC1C1U8_9ROSI|nr:hypothetical protein Patl1_19588 [Pistacia atlantica]